MVVQAEYIWMDGAAPTQKLRSKTKILEIDAVKSLKDLPEWGFDGSSTGQAPGDKSDCALKPVAFFRDPIRGSPNVLVMCEVMLADGTPHPSNTRAALRAVAEQAKSAEPWFGIEQEYTLFQGARPLGWPENGFPAPQFGYYCGVGADEVFGRKLVEAHTKACIEAGLAISGTNAEVMPAQWEFQIGPLGPLETSDQVWIARWLLYRLGEDFGIAATLYPKPVKGDWNGAGAHTNFSTKEMRAQGGMKQIEQACMALEAAHAKHIAEYGAHNEERLTGRHETAPITEFRWGVSDRGASIRIPLATVKNGCGYLEDRRPAANMDPYRVTRLLLETVVLGIPGDKNVSDGGFGVVIGRLPKRKAPGAGH
ncbi:MAG TPA: glutamine synthetase GlnII [Candidatus Thermoplasmatota archaeon]|nr:glutamine synthetase GlnII [Candidatus Thermoplasmatota archaeon]